MNISAEPGEAAEPPVVWTGGAGSGGRSATAAIAMEARNFTHLLVDRENERVYVGNEGICFDGRTGKQVGESRLGKMVIKTALALGADGYFYTHAPKGTNAGRIYRYDREMRPAPFTGLKVNYIDVPGSIRGRARGITADVNGTIYVLRQREKGGKRLGDSWDANDLVRYEIADGKASGRILIKSEIRSLSSVKLDSRGNIYLALGLRSGKDTLPPGLEGRVPATKKDPHAVGGYNYYPLIYGSIVKFGPEGGKVGKGVGGVECNYSYTLTTEVKGAKWFFPGVSNAPSWRQKKAKDSPNICLCDSPRIDVDGFGRCFFPDVGRFRVGVIDANGNEVGWFGSYGNQDSAGPGSAVPTPEIPFCWLQTVAASDEAVYVGDRVNRRVVRVKISYAVEESRPLR
jgi:hypothetical protein